MSTGNADPFNLQMINEYRMDSGEDEAMHLYTSDIQQLGSCRFVRYKPSVVAIWPVCS